MMMHGCLTQVHRYPKYNYIMHNNSEVRLHVCADDADDALDPFIFFDDELLRRREGIDAFRAC
jgi:hypothetical protein